MFDRDTVVLIVDDMQSMRRIIASGLREMGIKKTYEAEDGDIAWAMLNKSLKEGQEKIDIIISDWNMPRMKGIDLLKKVRSSEEFKNIPFLMVTAENEQKAVIQAVKEKVSNYIVKPFSPDTLMEKIKWLYNKYHG